MYFSLGLEKAVEKLIEHGANVNAKNVNGNTPLIAATKFGISKQSFTVGDLNMKLLAFSCTGHVKIIEHLVRHGADVNVHSFRLCI